MYEYWPWSFFCGKSFPVIALRFACFEIDMRKLHYTSESGALSGRDITISIHF